MASNIPQFDVVCEGPTDFVVIEAALVAIFKGADFVLQRVQPPDSLYGGDAGSFGGGWQGVKRWCESIRTSWGSMAAARAGIAGEILIIHVDADIAGEAEFNCVEACPPARATADNVRSLMLDWMGDQKLPMWLVLCVPSKDTDAWVLAALYPDDEWALDGIECRLGPAERFLNKSSKLVRRRDGKLQKKASSYAAAAHRITANWDLIKSRCGEALRFEQEAFAAIQSHGE